jgi:hypothetical protein
MALRRYVTPLTLVLLAASLLVAASCSDQTGPSAPAVSAPLAAVVPPPPLGTHILQQAVTAPRLQTYRMSFWAKRGTQTTVAVFYRWAPGQWLPDPFLRFKIPINGLVAGAGGVPLARGDSVLITMSIDTVLFSVDFQPSGVAFSPTSPAQLAVWYKNANPDLNGDGVVNADDEALQQQLAIWYQGKVWFQQWSKSDTTNLSVSGPIYHFSQYAVGW